jgi:hypothetical protein
VKIRVFFFAKAGHIPNLELLLPENTRLTNSRTLAILHICSLGILKAGDSVSFRSDSPHVISNPGKDILRLFWVISPPRNRER